ncbi:Putative ribonuclease H protein [Arachis hypogaea]|nr:Putative ribonuclease H protein [Arachis hypogaea]
MCKQIWKLKLLQRLEGFSWLLCQEALLTNLKRKRRGLTENGNCIRCHEEEETLLHVLWNCLYARTVWISMVNRDSQALRGGKNRQTVRLERKAMEREGLQNGKRE